MTWLWLGIAVIGALALMIAVIVGVFSKHQACYWRTAHNNHEALGSVMTKTGPRFLYHCRDCGLYWTEPWN